MAAVPKSFTQTGLTASTDIGTVPASKAWLIKSFIVNSSTGSTDKVAGDIGGIRILEGPAFTSGGDQNLDLLVDTQTGQHMRTVVASAAEVVRYVVIVQTVSKSVRLSVIEVDV